MCLQKKSKGEKMMKKLLSLSVLIAMFAFISCTEVRDSAGNDENSSATPEKTTYTVTFYSNDETNKSYTQTFVSGESQLLNENCFTRTGYNFAGWNTKRNGYGTSYSDRARLTATYDITLYAQWIYVGSQDTPDNPVKTYTVTFNSNDGTNKSYTQTFVSGQSQNLNVNCFVRTGYTFAGWNTNASGYGTSYADKRAITIYSDKTLYAQWTYIGNEDEPDPNPNPNPNPDNPVQTYTVVFDANGGNGEMSDISLTYDVAEQLPANTFYRTGYTFVGWAVTPNGSVFYTDEEDVLNITTKDKTTMTLYAVWKENESGITITLPDSNDAQINLKRIVSEDKAVFSAKSGFDSYGWYIDGIKQSETSATFAIDTLTMKPANYKVMVIVADGDEYYSATADLEIKRVQ